MMYTSPNSSSFRQKSTGFGNTSFGVTGRRSTTLFSGRRTPFLSSGGPNRSMLQTSQIIEETGEHRIEGFGPSLPVLITEALTKAENFQGVSVKIDPSGWLLMVCGRKLFAWHFKPTKSLIRATFCKELSLPQTELVHQAELTAITATPGRHTAVVVVSPEGVVRYWPSINNEGIYWEVNTSLNGDVCSSLISLESMGYVVATMTNDLFMVLNPGGPGMQNTLVCRPLTVSSGVFAKVSSFIFGSQKLATPPVPPSLVVGETFSGGQQLLYTVASNNLKKWLLALPPENTQVIYELQLEDVLKPYYAEDVWGNDDEEETYNNMTVWILDMKMVKKGVLILAAAENTKIAPKQVHYALATLDIRGETAPTSLLSFVVCKMSLKYQGPPAETALTFGLLSVDPTGSYAYLHNNKDVICSSTVEGFQLHDTIQFRSPGDRLLGAGVYGKRAVFFSASHGLVALTSTGALQGMMGTGTHQSSVLSEISLGQDSILGGSMDKVLELSTSDDRVQRLKAAFLHACRQNMEESQSLVDGLLPASNDASSATDLDNLVVALGKDLVDDFPASDPRWSTSTPQESATAVKSLSLSNQMEDKLKAHECFIQFLKSVKIWNKLSTVVVDDQNTSSHLMLCEYGEKISAALALLEHHTKQAEAIINRAIQHVLELRGDSNIPPNLTPQDIFYRKISHIDEIIEALVTCEEGMFTSKSSQKNCSLITTVNHIIKDMVKEACEYRKGRSLIFQSPSSKQAEFVPWTATSEETGIRKTVINQHTITVEQGIREVDQDIKTRGLLFDDLVALTDIILDGSLSQLATAKAKLGEGHTYYLKLMERYQRERTTLITPFVELKQYERAALLAEKYCDFGILVNLCDITNDDPKLQHYMNLFSGQVSNLCHL